MTPRNEKYQIIGFMLWALGKILTSYGCGIRLLPFSADLFGSKIVPPFASNEIVFLIVFGGQNPIRKVNKTTYM